MNSEENIILGKLSKHRGALKNDGMHILNLTRFKMLILSNVVIFDEKV
jgi:hypothetical protein